MINARPIQNGRDASDLVAVLLSNVGGLHNQASILSADVRRLYGKIEGTHRAADRLHRKIRSASARIRTFRSADRLRRRKRQWAVTAHKVVNLLQIGLTPFSKL